MKLQKHSRGLSFHIALARTGMNVQSGKEDIAKFSMAFLTFWRFLPNMEKNIRFMNVQGKVRIWALDKIPVTENSNSKEHYWIPQLKNDWRRMLKNWVSFRWYQKQKLSYLNYANFKSVPRLRTCKISKISFFVWLHASDLFVWAPYSIPMSDVYLCFPRGRICKVSMFLDFSQARTNNNRTKSQSESDRESKRIVASSLRKASYAEQER